VYTGPCFANGEMGLTGKEAILVWSITEGGHNGVALDGLNVIVVLRASGTLMDVNYTPESGEALILTDTAATRAQAQALADFAEVMAADLIDSVVGVESQEMDVSLGSCSESGCASVRAGDIVEISTRCLHSGDKHCGNETAFYPPLLSVDGARPAYTEVASFQGKGLNTTWESVEQRSTFLASFSR